MSEPAATTAGPPAERGRRGQPERAQRERGAAALERADVLGMLASYGDRASGEVAEELGSLEVTWLVAQVEQRYSVLLDLDDVAFATMSTVTGALDVLRAALPAGAGGGDG
jgi:hypothetical protein